MGKYENTTTAAIIGRRVWYTQAVSKLSYGKTVPRLVLICAHSAQLTICQLVFSVLAVFGMLHA
jgi:hypothetical protein